MTKHINRYNIKEIEAIRIKFKVNEEDEEEKVIEIKNSVPINLSDYRLSGMKETVEFLENIIKYKNKEDGCRIPNPQGRG